MLLDLAPFALGAALLALATGRPLFVGVVAAALGAGFYLADHTMRETLREPVVFSESVELPQVVTHPHLYLPFAGPGLVIGGALAAAAAAAALLILEPPVSEPRPLAALAAVALTAAGIWAGRASGRSAPRRARCAESPGQAASRSRIPPRSGRSRHCWSIP